MSGADIVAQIGANVAALRGVAAEEALDRLFEQRVSWISLMKTVRLLYGVDLESSYRLVLSHPGWRRWSEGRINSEPECRKMALHDLRRRGESVWVERDGAQLRLRPL